jgi:hypothetical protein
MKLYCCSLNVKKLKDEVKVYTSAHVLGQIELNISTMILIALLNGGDYSKAGHVCT